MSESQIEYGIIGYPLGHSLSPLMHNTAFQELGVDAVYKLFPIQEDEFDKFFEYLKEPDCPIFGFNVTVPYKEKVIQYLDILSPFAKKVMAVNTVVISEDRKLSGYNTDAPGFLAHLAELKFSVEGKRIAILGAGGTTRSILAALCLLPERPESIKIYNRSTENLEKLLEDLAPGVNLKIVEAVSTIEDLNIEICDLLINTTSVGLKESDPCLVDEEMFHVDLLVYDAIYNPQETKLLKIAKMCGAKTVNGLGMLFYQGVLAFQHWAGAELDQTVKAKMRKSLDKGFKTKS